MCMKRRLIYMSTATHHFSQIRIHHRHHDREAGKHLGLDTSMRAPTPFTQIKGTVITVKLICLFSYWEEAREPWGNRVDHCHQDI